jgi:uncharacterized membrane protein
MRDDPKTTMSTFDAIAALAFVAALASLAVAVVVLGIILAVNAIRDNPMVAGGWVAGGLAMVFLAYGFHVLTRDAE